jgi:nucleoside-diphosphate-sugar epimerase
MVAIPVPTPVDSTRVVGRGMLAKAFEQIDDELAGTLVFAGGVSDSGCRDESAYSRERALLESALERCHLEGLTLVYFSSAGAVYGDYPYARHENTPVSPGNLYGIRKLEFERLIRASGANHLILRLPNVAGLDGNPANLVPALVGQVTRGRVTVHRSATRDIIAVEDAVEIVRRLLRAAPHHEVVVVATRISTPVRQIVHRICRILSVSPVVDMVERDSVQIFDTAKLESLIVAPQFDADYPFKVLDRYVPALAGHRAC